MRAYPLFSFDPVRNEEMFYIEFDAGVRHESLPHVTGVEEYVFLVHGTLKMVIGGKEVLLQENSPYGLGLIFPTHTTMFWIKPAPLIM